MQTVDDRGRQSPATLRRTRVPYGVHVRTPHSFSTRRVRLPFVRLSVTPLRTSFPGHLLRRKLCSSLLRASSEPRV